MSDIKKKISVDIQRLNASLLQSDKLPKRRPPSPSFSALTDESKKEIPVGSNKSVDDEDEICKILFWLKRLFPKEPEMVNRLILEIQRYFKQESRAKMCLQQEPTYPPKHCQELESLRLYLRNIDSIAKPIGNPKTVNFFDEYHIMKKAGIGLPQVDIFNISMSIHYLLGMSPHISKIRFWGKINGIFKDYYILECDLSPEEIKLRNEKKQEELEKARNFAASKENQSKIQYLSTDSKSEILQNMVEKDNTKLIKEAKPSNEIELGGEEEQSVVEEVKPFNTHEIDYRILELKNLPSKFDTFKIPDRPGIEVVEDWIVPEDDVGFGTNKKLYLVSNNTYNNWCELPNVTPHQIVVARQIKRFFTGILAQAIETCPAFPGTEGNYLRAQIARISAGTQVSPLGYYHFNLEEEEGDVDEEEGEDSGNKAAGCVLNEDYFPMLMAELGAKTALDFWAHHTEHILKQGRTVYWSPFAAQAGDEGGEVAAPQDIPKGPDLLTPISNDVSVNGVPCWTISCKSQLFPDSATAVARSNIWPGAFAYAYSTFANTVYIGWGHKLDVFGHTPAQPNFPQSEYEVGPDIMESTDPTVEETELWIEEHTPKPPPIDMLGEGEGEQSPGEEEEEDDDEE